MVLLTALYYTLTDSLFTAFLLYGAGICHWAKYNVGFRISCFVCNVSSVYISLNPRIRVDFTTHKQDLDFSNAFTITLYAQLQISERREG